MIQIKSYEPKSWRLILRVLTIVFLAISILVMPVMAQEGNHPSGSKPNIVLVHGAWADGSSWSAVIARLQLAGYNVVAPQFPLTSTADDVARLRQVLAVQEGPTLVAGHSYGGHAPLQRADAWIEHYKSFWDQRLDALGDYLEKRK